MPDPFLGEIRIFPFNFAPIGWAMCNGQMLQIGQNAALFSVIGTNYGGNGTSNFALPDLEGNVPLCAGAAPALTPYDLGEFGGSQTFTLQDAQNPVHSHPIAATSVLATTPDPKGAVYARGEWSEFGSKGAVQIYNSDQPSIRLSSSALSFVGGAMPHNNMMPTLTLNFCIALTGEFPQRP